MPDETPDVRVAACCVGKSGSEGMTDWISHHLAIGFDHLYMYNNGSLDRFKGIMDEQTMEQASIVDFNVEQGEEYIVEAYADCYRSHRNEYDWMAFFGPDEYLLLQYGDSIKQTLRIKAFRKFDAVRVNLMDFSDYIQLCRDLGVDAEDIVDFRKIDSNKKIARSIVNCKARGLLLGPYSPKRNGQTVRQCLPNLVEVYDSKNVGEYKGVEIDKVDTNFMYITPNKLELQWWKWKNQKGY